MQGVVVDKKNRLPIPFATIAYRTDKLRNVFVVDAQGRFSLGEDVRQITVSCLGYTPRDITIEALPPSPWIIELEEKTFLISELVVTPQNNPALRIIRNVLKNKDRHNFEKYEAYAYRCYFKVSMNRQIRQSDSTPDSLSSEKKGVLLSETLTLSTKNGARTEDRIIATRTAGFDTPIFGQSAYLFFHKAISFYNNSISIIGESEVENRILTDYLSPLSDGCLSAYTFQLENTYMNGADSLFEISYFPKRNTKFDGLMGTMFISSDGYALTTIVAHPFEKKLIDFKFRQSYEQVEGRWFPKSLEEEIGFLQTSAAHKPTDYIAYFVSATLDSIRFSLPTGRSGRSVDKVYLDEKSIRQSEALLERLRSTPLYDWEKKSYEKIDSLFRSLPLSLETLINAVPKLEEGKLGIGKIDVDLLRFYTQNDYEGTRWGLGLYTNEHLMRYLSVGGYAGYGLSDKRWKYGAGLTVFLNRRRSMQLNYIYENSLRMAGSKAGFTYTDTYGRSLVASLFEYYKEHRLEGRFHLLPSLQLNLALSTADVNPAYAYGYQGQQISSYQADAMQLSLRYARGEKYSLLGVTRLRTSIGNPVFTATYTRGSKVLRKHSLAYNKVEASIDFIAYNGRIGQSNLRLEGGYIDRSLPYSFLFTGEGSRGEPFSFIVNKTFQTMRPDEFLSDKYAHLFYKHNFGSLLLKTKYLRPEFSLLYNAGWGNLSQPADHDIPFRVKDHLYQETGLIVDNILRIPLLRLVYLRLGAGAFTRLGYYQQSPFTDNITLKTSLTFSFK
jgi:hypothetical protein